MKIVHLLLVAVAIFLGSSLPCASASDSSGNEMLHLAAGSTADVTVLEGVSLDLIESKSEATSIVLAITVFRHVDGTEVPVSLLARGKGVAARNRVQITTTQAQSSIVGSEGPTVVTFAVPGYVVDPSDVRPAVKGTDPVDPKHADRLVEAMLLAAAAGPSTQEISLRYQEAYLKEIRPTLVVPSGTKGVLILTQAVDLPPEVVVRSITK